MEYADLERYGPFAVLARCTQYREAEKPLRSVFGNQIPFSSVVRSGPSSIRIFSKTQFEDFIRIPDGSDTAFEIGAELSEMSQSGEARYPEPQPPGTKKGWVLKSFKYNREMVVLAEAAWI